MVAMFAERGHDAAHIEDLSPAATPDSVIALIAHRAHRCLITGDFDFANIREFDPRDYSGIVILTAPRGTGAPHLHRLVREFLERLPELAPLEGKLLIVEIGRIRVRP